MEWENTILGEIAKIQTGPFGSQLHQSDYVSEGIPCIMPTNIGQSLNINIENIAHIKESDAIRLSRHLTQEGDIIYSRRGDIEKCAYITKNEKGWLCGTGCLRVICSKEIVNPHFIAYYLSTQESKKWIVGNAVGTTMLNLNGGILSSFPIKLPNRSTQNNIVAILSSLDAKIENNNKINANLEAQAAALFKSWFVDFEPFKDGEFVESELGMIPKGWKVGTYEDIIEGTVSGDWGKETPQGNYTHEVACIRGCDFQDMSNGVRGKTPQRYILEKNYTTKKLNDKDILVEISGGTQTVSTGRVCLVSDQMLQKYNYDIVCTNFCRVVRPLAGFSAYIYYSWLYKYNKKVMFGYENGTSGIKNFQMKDFLSKEPVLIPSLDCLVKFQKLIDTLQNTIQSNGTENTKLSSLRDTLLPKLMSGEIDLDNIKL